MFPYALVSKSEEGEVKTLQNCRADKGMFSDRLDSWIPGSYVWDIALPGEKKKKKSVFASTDFFPETLSPHIKLSKLEAGFGLTPAHTWFIIFHLKPHWSS